MSVIGGSIDEKKKQLIDELANVPVNMLNVRMLCKDTPGLIATSGIRTRVWSLLLLGTVDPCLDDTVTNGCSMDNIGGRICDEYQVLLADVKRTRGDVKEFRSNAYRQVIHDILLHFCLKHNVQYKQGMNEVLAPFIFLLLPVVAGADASYQLTFALFEALLFRYLERYFFLDDSSYLFKSFRMLQLLLEFHDPQLGRHLNYHNFLPEVYSPQWFLTMFSRALPLVNVLRLWDMLIAMDEPAFIFFIGVALIRRKREQLLLADMDKITEIIGSTICLYTEQDIDNIVVEGMVLYKITPRCFIKKLRVCSVSTTNIMTLPKTTQVRMSYNASSGSSDSSSGSGRCSNSKNHDLAMAVQSACSCVLLSPQEFLDSYESDSVSQTSI